MAFLLQCHDYCLLEGIEFRSTHLPAGANKLLKVATAVKPQVSPAESGTPLWQRLNPLRNLRRLAGEFEESLGFIGEVAVAL